MRYANPWLYGSVRAPGGLLLGPAFALCVCSDYMNGTKRSGKKSPTVCKKCKGTRLPVPSGDAKFGTVRCYPTAHPHALTPMRAGTVRVTSSSSRASILPAADPYDLMRRSRMAVQDSSCQFRARSTSPSKGRTAEQSSHGGFRGGETTPNGTGRRSILECDINPYDLMQSDDKPKDANIKLVGGQRVRVRQPPPEHEYEDVQVKPKIIQVQQ